MRFFNMTLALVAMCLAANLVFAQTWESQKPHPQTVTNTESDSCFALVAPTGIYYHVVISGALSHGQPLNIGDQIALVDGDLLVGSGVFGGTYPVEIAARGADVQYDLPGYTVGHQIGFQLCTTPEQPRIAGTVWWTQGGSFGDDPYSVAAMVAFSPPLGACCAPTGGCEITYEFDCPLPSLWNGEWTLCEPNPCVQILGACCAPDQTCTLVTQDRCEGVWYFGMSCPRPGHPEDPDPCGNSPVESKSWGQIKMGYGSTTR